MKEIINKGDYTFELLDEIKRDVASLSTYVHDSSNHLEKVQIKLSRAKKIWLNISRYEEKVFVFRKTIFLRNIKLYLDKVKTEFNNVMYDVDSMIFNMKKEHDSLIDKLEESEFIKVKDKFDYLDQIQDWYKNLEIEVRKHKLKKMIYNMTNSSIPSDYNMEKVTSELINLKKSWADVSDLEDMIMW